MVDEHDIKMALESKAQEVRVPKDLAARTMKAAQDAGAPSALERLRARRDAQRMRGNVRGYPRWMAAPAAAALAIALFAIGSVVTRQPSVVGHGPVELQKGVATTRGTVSGVVSSGRTSVDARNSASTGGASASVDSQIAPAPPVPVPPNPGTGQFPPKIIKNADVQVQVRHGSFDGAWKKALDVAARYGGFVTNSSTQQTGDRIGSGNFTMRVPATKIDAAIMDLRNLGTLKSLTTSGNDISGQIVDVNARIRADEAEQAQLLDLLRQANKVSDVLAIRNQLQSVQQDLESLRGQKKAFENQVDYATINATIFEPNAGPEPVPVGNESILLRAWRVALGAGLTIIAGTLVVFGGLIPLALLALGIWALVAMARRRRT